MEIALKTPFNFDHTLSFLRGFSPMAGEQRASKDTLVKSWIVRGTPVTVTMRQEGSKLVCEHASNADEKVLADRVASFVSADEDLGAFYDIAKRDEHFAPVARKLRG